MMYYNDFYPFSGCGFGLGPIFSVLFWLLIILLIIFLLRRRRFFGHNHMYDRGTGRSNDILKERYAKGEITKEQFESMKKDLQ